MARAITYTNTDLQNITFRNQNNLETWIQPNRTRGRPRNKWADKALEEMWTERVKQKTTLSANNYDIKNQTVIAEIKEYANNLIATP